MKRLLTIAAKLKRGEKPVAKRIASILVFLGILGVLVAGATALAASLSGAIFTTTPDGGIVNENVRYERKIDVYLDGGPGPNAPQTAAGLPDGNYFFQVTDPSGAVLLSENPAKCREIRAQDGVIVELVSIGRTYGNGPKTTQCSIQDPPNPPSGPGTAGPSGRHDTNVDNDHWPPAIVVQLMPFFDTPNPGGVYKAWVIPTSRYVANGGNPEAIPQPYKVKGKQVGYQRDPGFGPPRDQVKTDNFKVKEVVPPSEITVRKFHDVDGDGIWDAGEPEIGIDQCVDGNGNIVTCPGGWPYDFTSPLDGGTLTERFYTPYTHLAALPGTYSACELMLAGWAQTALYIDGVQQTTALCGSVQVVASEKHTIVFGDTRPGKVSGQKFIDYDADGVQDAEDVCPSVASDPVNNPGCAGITVHLVGTDNLGNPVNRTTVTDENGLYEFAGVMPGTYTYTVTVDEPPGFYCSYPSPCNYSLGLESGQNQSGKNFGDFSLADLFGIKFLDRNGDGVKDAGEAGLPDWEIHLDGTAARDNPVLPEGTSVHRVTWTCGGVNVPNCLGNPVGTYWFNDLVPGNYTISEVMAINGWTQTAPKPVPPGTWTINPTSDQVCQNKDFGNFGPCEGLTPGYWSNWRNHYTEAQFLVLLQGTIAAGNIGLADGYLSSLGCDNDDALHCMRRFLLSDQLTLNLTQHPELPNPSGGALISACSIQGIGTLQSAIADGLAILANPSGYIRDQILAVKNRLAAFAEL